MLAYTYVERGKFELREKPLPQLIDPRDALVRVTLGSICTSDLHIKHGSVPRAVPGITVGHEMVGVVEQVGPAVTTVAPGDRVVVNVETFCGECFFCQHGYVNNCTDPQGGWALGCRIDGGQAEYVRVPYADCGLTPIPAGVSDEQALFVGDILATGFWATRISSLSSYYTGSKIKYSSVTWNDKKYEFGYMEGTSMASPFVTGVMATWLQAFPEMTPEIAREILQKTSRQDDFTGTIDGGSNLWGYGKIDAYAGIKECIRYESGIEPSLADNRSHLVVNDGNCVRVLFGYDDSQVALQLYNLQGACVATRAIGKVAAGEELTLSLDGAAAGVYLLQLSGDNTQTMVKKIIIQ